MERVSTRHSENFWQVKPATVAGMLLQDDVPDLGDAERDEILAQLPALEGKSVLELGAGIGRYTSHFVRVAGRVTVVDFVERFLEQNRQANSAFGNVTFHCDNVMNMEFEPGSFDFVFWNWLLMYLVDADVSLLRERIRSWTRIGGVVFFRESCRHHLPPQRIAPDNPATYRPAEVYTRLFEGDFRLLRSGYVQAYERLAGRDNQRFWLLERCR